MNNEARDPNQVPVRFITDGDEAREVLTVALRTATRFAVDTETVIVRDADGKPVKRDFDVDGPGPWRVMSIATKCQTPHGVEYRTFVLDMAHINAALLQGAFWGLTPWGWNAPFDRGVLARGGLTVRRWKDGMLYDAVLKQGAYYAAGERAWYTSLADAAKRWLGLDGLDGKDDTRLSYDETTPLTNKQVRYAADDAVTTLWVGEALEAAASRQGLLEACERSTNAQPFVHGMKVAGLPFDASTYQSVVDNAVAKANAAAERIAVLTTGQEVLRTLLGWAVTNGHATISPDTLKATHASAQEEVITAGLTLLHDQSKFSLFLADLRALITELTAKIAGILGVSEEEDLFAPGTRFALPFEIGNDTSIRRWINKTVPQFVSEYISEIGGTSKGLVVASGDLGLVYKRMVQQPADVTAEVAQIAACLEAISRYSRIVNQYTSQAGTATLVPDWKVGSDDQVKDHLNRFAQDEVLAYTAKVEGAARLLGKADSVDKRALKLIGGPLAEAILNFREHDKTVTTYGDELIKCVHPVTGRIHANYTQDLTSTARLSSYAPNAQNLSPQSKPHMGMVRKTENGDLVSRDPHGRIRVIAYADLSQAELRFLAHMAQDTNMLEAFRSGEDLHQRTATLMFGIDLKALKANKEKPISKLAAFVKGLDPYVDREPNMLAADLYKQLRSKAKAVSFGYAYGLKGASLAQQLTAQGVPTTREEANQLLAQFDASYPQVAAWMAKRVRFIQDLADAIKDQSQPSGVDFEASWKLHKLYYRAYAAKKTLKARLDRQPTDREIAEHLLPDENLRANLTSGDPEKDQGPEWDTRWEQARARQAEMVAWALGHYGSAILAEDGTPWAFESRNSLNRRRLFQIGTANWVMSMVSLVARSRRKYAMDLTAAWVREYNAELQAREEARASATEKPVRPIKAISLTKVDPRTNRETPLLLKELEKALPTKELRISFVSYVLDAYETLPNPAAARDYLFRHAMADCIKAAGNEYRNHPIQSGVADVVLEAFYRIDKDLETRFPTAQGIQSVHDSISIECDLAEAKAVREMLVRHMQEAMSEVCPTVPCVADGEILLSLDDHTALTDAELDDYIHRYATAA